MARKINAFDVAGPPLEENPSGGYLWLNTETEKIEARTVVPSDDTAPPAGMAKLVIDGTQVLSEGQDLSLRVLAVSEDGLTVQVEHVETQLGQLEEGEVAAIPVALAGPPVQQDLWYPRQVRRWLRVRQELQNQSGSITPDADDGNIIHIGLADDVTVADIANAAGDWGQIVVWQQGGTDKTVTFAGDKFSALNDLTADTGANVRTVYGWEYRESLGGGTVQARIEVYRKAGAGAGGVPIVTNPGQVMGDGVPGATMSVVGFAATGATNPDTYQWQIDMDGDGSGSDIGGATSATYVAAAGDAGGNLRRKTTASNGSGSADGFTPWVPISALRREPVVRSQAVNRASNY